MKSGRASFILVLVSRKFRLFSLAAVAVALAGCSSHHDSTGPFGQETPSTASVSTTTPSPYAVPATIDKEYVGRVIARLEEVRASVRRDVYASKQYTDADQKRLEAIFDEPALSFQENVWREAAGRDNSDMVPSPGPAQYSIDQIVTATPTCVWFKTTTSEAGNYVDKGVHGTRADLVLRVRVHDESINKTPWVLTQFAPESLNIVDSSRACG